LWYNFFMNKILDKEIDGLRAISVGAVY
jgi:hypothetical protein